MKAMRAQLTARFKIPDTWAQLMSNLKLPKASSTASITMKLGTIMDERWIQEPGYQKFELTSSRYVSNI